MTDQRGPPPPHPQQANGYKKFPPHDNQYSGANNSQPNNHYNENLYSARNLTITSNTSRKMANTGQINTIIVIIIKEMHSTTITDSIMATD